MDFQHKSGILMHITSLPGPFGIGDIGPAAYKWLDFLAATGCKWWQVLPVGPTGYGDSPYQSFSSFAGNPVLVSPELMLEDGLVDQEHLENAPHFPTGKVDFQSVIEWKRGLFQVAFMRLGSLTSLRAEFDEFRGKNEKWLEDFSLFMTIKAQQDLRAWTTWPGDLRDRGPEAMKAARQKYASTQSYYAFQQFLFFRQWVRLRQRMAELDIKLIGDLPIYAAPDSSDVWVDRHLFEMDVHGKPYRVAGVPPDMFSATGQLWGNPLYRWDVMKKHGYAWWLWRLRANLDLVDVLRLDHFRGFADYYAVPFSEPTAENGTWELGPGADFLQTVREKLGDLPLIAEELGGEASPLVIKLRDDFKLPGMKVFQFGFDAGREHVFLPHNYPVNCVAYTGTHDNDTAMGWFANAPKTERRFAMQYLNSDGKHFAWDLIAMLWDSRADLVVAPLQDFLELGTEARMNYPGRPLGNWGWRVQPDALTDELAEKIADLNKQTNRKSDASL
jgi:4-alpha-glucanotransferase